MPLRDPRQFPANLSLWADIFPAFDKRVEYHGYCVENLKSLLVDFYSATEPVFYDYLVATSALRLKPYGHWGGGRVVHGVTNLAPSYLVRTNDPVCVGLFMAEGGSIVSEDADTPALRWGQVDHDACERPMLVAIDEGLQIGQQTLPAAVLSSVGLDFHHEPPSLGVHERSLLLPVLDRFIPVGSASGCRVGVLLEDREIDVGPASGFVADLPRDVIEAASEVCDHVSELERRMMWLGHSIEKNDHFMRLAWNQAQLVGVSPLAVNLKSSGVKVAFLVADGFVLDRCEVSLCPVPLKPSVPEWM